MGEEVDGGGGRRLIGREELGGVLRRGEAAKEIGGGEGPAVRRDIGEREEPSIMGGEIRVPVVVGGGHQSWGGED